MYACVKLIVAVMPVRTSISVMCQEAVGEEGAGGQGQMTRHASLIISTAFGNKFFIVCYTALSSVILLYVMKAFGFETSILISHGLYV